MSVCQDKSLDPSHFVIIKPLTIRSPGGIKQQGCSSVKHGVNEPNQEKMFRRRYQRLSQQACGRACVETGGPLYPMAVQVLGSAKQVDEKAQKKWSPSAGVTGSAVLKPTGRCKSPMKEDSSTLKNHLCHVRRLMTAVRQGRGYFHLLQKEEQELKEAQAREQRRIEGKRRTECRPPCYESDSDSESPFRTMFSTGGSWPSQERRRRKKFPATRPFTPIYHSLSSPQLPSVALEPLFRQLCCLNWLLEAMTLNPPGRTGPVSSCWDITDPGRSRVTVKSLNKEKAIEMRWDQFISQPKPRKGRCLFSGLSGRPFRRASVFSLSSSSASPRTARSRSVSSLALGPLDPPALSVTAPSVDNSPRQGPGDPRNKSAPPKYELKLDTLSQSAVDEFAWPEQDSDSATPQEQLSAVRQFVESKSSMLDEIRSSFQERAVELTSTLNDTLECTARNRLHSGIHTYQALSRGLWSPARSRPVTVMSRTRSAPENVSRPSEDGMWLTRLIAGLPEAALQDRRVGRLLEKLRRFADGRSLRTRPPAFLKVLGGLQPWELCSPDVCVAIEIIREHVVGMTEVEYDLWLQSRVTVPEQVGDLPTGGAG
ncbi:hypothetical protein GJAV_G00033520 [Gymnothorax javanicus]|nr:hypothetical protein GJAV_G00033520 [Gymnothorax javanicus]